MSDLLLPIVLLASAIAPVHDPVVEAPRPAGDAVISVTDFGAEPDSGDCAGEAFAAAFEEARRVGAAKVVFPTGRYDFHDAPTRGRTYFRLDGFSDLTIDGQGSELVFHQVRRAFEIRYSERLLFRDFIVDWNVQMAIGGEIAEDDDGGHVLHVYPEFSVDEDTNVRVVEEYDFENHRWAPVSRSLWHPDEVELIDERTLAISDLQDRWEPGQQIIARTVKKEGEVFNIGTDDPEAEGSRHLAFEDITVYRSPGMVWKLEGADYGFRFSRNRIKLRPGTDRIMSAAADGIWFASVVGGILIEDCQFSHQGDDAVNLHGGWLRVDERRSDRELRLSFPWPQFPRIGPGDELIFCDGEMRPYGRAKVVEIAEESADRPRSRSARRVVVDRDLPEQLERDHLVRDTTRTANGFVIRNNHFHSNRARAMLIQASHGLIENNRMAHTTLNAVRITTDADHWLEGFPVENVIFRNNHIRSTQSVASHPGTLSITAWTPEGISPAPVHQNIVIEGNTFEELPGMALLVGSAGNVIVRNNTIHNANLDGQPDHFYRHRDVELKGSIMIFRAANVLLDRNTETASDGREPGGIHVHEDSTENVRIIGP